MTRSRAHAALLALAALAAAPLAAAPQKPPAPARPPARAPASPAPAPAATPAPTPAHPATDGTRCAVCHSAEGWRPVTFDHAKTGFPLVGRHQQQSCTACHGSDLSRKLPQSCAACHRDQHAGEFGTRCSGCHDENSWRPLFDADAHRRTNFPLTGRHAFLPCQECHLDRRDRSYTRSTVSCVGCHQAQYDRTGAGASLDHRAVGFSTNCRDCHVPWSWSAATWAEHDRCFQTSRGPHVRIRCRDCHLAVPTGFTTGSCATNNASCTRCHTCSSVDGRHARENVAGYQCRDRKCYECHRFSVEGGLRPFGKGGVR